MAKDRLWWERDDLGYREGRLHIGGRDLATLVAASGTPTYVYSSVRVRDNLERLRSALGAHGVEHDVYYAIKANRYAPLVTYLKLLGRCGIDACSPNEVRYARQIGFEESEISYTGNSTSEADLEVLQAHPGVLVNCVFRLTRLVCVPTG
jgi:diaminopimelate decarboxylase